MKIQKKLRQHRRDFTAIYVCEHCEATEEGSGYDDAYFHNQVLPKRVCLNCGKASPEGSQPMTPRYAENETV